MTFMKTQTVWAKTERDSYVYKTQECAGIKYSWVRLSKCSRCQMPQCYHQVSVSLHLLSQCFSPSGRENGCKHLQAESLQI